MAERTGAVLLLVHVIDTEADRATRRLLRATLRTLERVPVANPDPVGDQVLEVAAARAAESGVVVERSVVTSDARSAAIVGAAARAGADLVVLGSSMSEVDGAAFFGRTAERVLEACPTGLVLVTTPAV
jgi:nucleotide-binding universal stress UspA family protein